MMDIHAVRESVASLKLTFHQTTSVSKGIYVIDKKVLLKYIIV